MNRLFGISGFLAAGMTIFWLWFVICLPWIPVYNSRSPAMARWVLWVAVVAVVAIGCTVAFAFLRCSLTAHWAALCRNTRLPASACRGVSGIYLLLMCAFSFPSFADDPSGTHQTERYLYIFLAACCLVLGALSIRNGFWSVSQDRANHNAST